MIMKCFYRLSDRQHGNLIYWSTAQPSCKIDQGPARVSMGKKKKQWLALVKKATYYKTQEKLSHAS